MSAKTKAKSKTTIKVSKKVVKRPETDSAYFLKLVLFLILSSLWLRITVDENTVVPLPAGAIIAVFYALHDHFQIDRKIELALILIGMFISFWLPIGIYVSLL